ncbi:unnamed protein product, partial [Sphacelaria rigidula]
MLNLSHLRKTSKLSCFIPWKPCQCLMPLLATKCKYDVGKSSAETDAIPVMESTCIVLVSSFRVQIKRGIPGLFRPSFCGPTPDERTYNTPTPHMTRNSGGETGNRPHATSEVSSKSQIFSLPRTPFADGLEQRVRGYKLEA